MQIIDPRYYQLLIQFVLLAWGMFALQFPVSIEHIIITIATAITTQWIFCWYLKLPLYTLSTINTSLSILLLAHSEHALWLAPVAILSIGSKFVLRFNKRHIYNPSNFGIVISLLIFDQVWAAPGQWGHGLWLFMLLAGLLLTPLLGLKSMLTSLSFLFIYTLLIFVRALWLGDPVSIPLHNLQNGSLLLFTFFMLADPMTTPSHPTAKIIFGSFIALLSGILLWNYYIPNAFLYALALSSPLVILLNKLFSHPYFFWKKQQL